MKILILKPSSLGDVIQALPVLRLLKQHYPESRIYWWIDTNLAPLLEDDPDLAGIVRFERKRWASPRHWPELWASLRWLRNQSFDLVIDLQCLARSGAFAWLANGNLLVGLDEPREGARGFYDIIVQRGSYHTHAIDWYLNVLRTLKIPVHFNFQWLPERPAIAADLRRKWGGSEGPWIALQPGARWINKRWPTQNYARLVQELAACRPRYRFVILGDHADVEAGAVISRAQPSRSLDLTGKLTLPEMIEWLRSVDLLISNDTGPMHAAAALGKPVVAIFGPTEPRRTGPYGQLHHTVQTDLPCVPCMKPFCSYYRPLECLHLVQVADVLAKVCEVL